MGKRKWFLPEITDHPFWRLGLFVSLVGLLNLFSPASPTVIQRILASGLLALAYLPTYMWIKSEKREIPFLPILSAIYAIYFSLPVFLREKYSRALDINALINDAHIEKALFYAVLGLASLFVGYYGVRYKLPRIPLTWTNDKVTRILGFAFGSIGLVAYSSNLANVEIPLSLQQIRTLIGDLSLVGMIILWGIDLSNGRLGRFFKVFLWGILVPLRTVFGLATGSTLQGLLVVLLYVMVVGIYRNKVPWVAVVVGSILILFVRPLQTEFRLTAWSEGNTQSVQGNVSLLGEIALEQLGEIDDEDLKERIQIVNSRLGHLMTFADVIQQTPTIVPYWEGYSYRPLPYKIVPRFIFQEKPQEKIGQDFGHRYGYLEANDLTTSYNLPQLIEFYVNFGVVGIILGMLLMGAFYKFVGMALMQEGAGIGNTVIAVLVSFKLLNIESNLSLVIGGIPWVVALGLLTHWSYLLLNRLFPAID